MPDPKDTSKTQRLKKVLWESNLNTPIRGFYNLMNMPYEDLVGGDAETTERIARDSLSVAGGVTAGSAFVPKPRGAITMGANRRGGGGSAPRPAKKAGGKAGGTSAPSGSSAAPQAGRASGGTSAPIGARSTAQAGRKPSGTSAPGGSAGRPQTGRKSGGTSAPGGPTGRPQTARKSGSAKPPGKSAATGATRTFGGKMKLGAAAGAGLLGFAAYKNSDKPKAGEEKLAEGRKDTGRRIIYSEPAGPKAPNNNSKADAFRKNRQGMNVPGSPTYPNTKKDGPKKAGDKSNAAAKPEKKMSNFERMKQRQYEKEGYGGRAMTSRGAESRVKKERSYKFKDLFSKKKR